MDQEEEKKGKHPSAGNVNANRVKQAQQVDSLAGALESELKGSGSKESGQRNVQQQISQRPERLESIKENSNEISRLSSMENAERDAKLDLGESFPNCINESNDSVSSVSPDNSRKVKVKGLI